MVGMASPRVWAIPLVIVTRGPVRRTCPAGGQAHLPQGASRQGPLLGRQRVPLRGTLRLMPDRGHSRVRSRVRKKLLIRMVMEAATTASVVARPTPSAPSGQVSPL